MKRNFSIKIRIIAAVLIAAFFAQDIVWANPDMLENRQSASTLQIPNFSQNVSLETVLETTLRRLSAYEYSPPTPTRLVIHDKGVQMELVLPPDADGNISCSTIANGSRQHFTARVLQDRSIQLLPVKDGAIPQRDTLLSEVAPDAAVNVSPANIQSANIQFANILPANVPLADIPLANAPENTPPSRKKLHLAAVVISVLALGISMTMPSQLSGYLTFPIYYTLLGLIGNYLASRMDGDRKWGRFAVAGALMFIVSSSYFPWYMNFTQTHIIDYGLWSHSLRPLMDIFIWSQPWHIISICAQGLRQRGEDISAGKGLFARLWSKESRTYLKEKVRLYYGRDGLLKTIILFWFPLIHFMYYSLTPVEYLQVSALIGPIWTVVSAVYYVQRPGHDLTPNPIVNKILKHVYFIPIISVVATTVIAGLSGNASLTLDCLSCILTTSVGYAAFRLLAWPVNYLFDRSPGSAAKTTSAAYARVGPDANTDGVLGISESVLNSPKTRWYDRTALIGLGGGDVLACKFLKEGEDAAVLEDEARAMKRLLDEGVYAPVPVGPEMGSYLFSYEGALLAAAPETAFHASRLYTAYVMNIKYYLRNSGDTTLNPSGDPDNSNRVSALGEPADDPFGGRSIASVSATPEKPARKSDGSHRVFKDTPLKFADGFTDQQREWIGSINNIVPPFHASGLKNIEKETQFKLEGHYDDGKIWLQSNMHEKKKFSETYAHELGHHVEELYMSDESTKAFYFLGWKNAAFPVRRVVAFIVAAPILAAWAIVKAGLAYDILMPAAVVLISVPIVIIFLRFGIGMADLGRPISMTVWLRTHWSILNYVSLYALQSQRDFFAETYMHYICFPELFRKKAGKNEEIKKQYEFMRARIFNGVEYFTDENTGDPRQIKRNMPAIATVRKPEGSPAVCLGAIITYCAGDLNKSFSAEELIDAGLRSHLVKKEGVSRDFAVSTVKLELRLLRQVGILDAMPGTRTSRYMLKPAIRDLSLSAAQDLVSSIQEISEFNHYDMPRDIRRMMRMVVRVVIHNASQEKVGLGLGFDITKAGIGRLLWTLSCFACYVKGKRREDKSGGENYKIKVSEIQDEIKKHPGALKALVEEILKRSGPGPEINIDDIPEEILVETIIDNGVYESIIQMGLAYAKGLPAHEVMDISVLHPGDTVHIVGEDEPRMVSTVSSADNELACDELVSVSSTDFSFNENKKIELILEPSAPKKSDSSSAACLEGIMKYCGDNLAREFTIVDLMRAKLMLRFVKSSGKEKIFARSGVKNKLKFLYDIDVLDIIPGPWFRRYRLKSDIRDLPLPAARQLVSRIQNIPTLTYHYVPKEGCSITRDTVRDLYKEAARKPRNSWNSGNTTLNSAIDPISAAPQPDDSQPDDSSAIKIGGSALGGNQVRIDRIDEPSRVSLSGMALETPTRRVEGSPAVCLEAIIKYCGGDLSKSFSAYELIAGGFRSRAVKEYGASKDFALSTVKFELRLLRQVGVLDVVSGSRTYRYILKSDIRDLSPPELQALIVSIQNISALNHYDMSDSLRRKTRSSVRALIREPLVRRNDALAERTIIMESGAGDTFTGAVLSAHNGEFYILSAGHNFEKIDDVHGYIRVTRSGEEKVVRLDGRVVKFKNDGRGRDFSLLKLRGPADIEFEPLTIGDPPVSDGFSAYIPFIDIDKITDLAVANGYLYKVFLPAKRYAQSPGEDVNQLYIYTDTSALKQHGVSGSPVYKDGKLVGMVCFMDIEAEGACAVTGNAIRAFLETTEYAAAISDPGKFLRNIVDTKELTQNMIEGILSQLFSNKKLTLAFSRKLSGLQSKQLGALLKQLNKWKESTARGNAKMKSLLDNFTILEYDDLKAELDRRGIDARAKDAVILTYAPKPEDGSSDTSSLGGAVRPVYIIEETGAFPADFYYPLLEMVTVSLAKELLRWNKVELKEALIASNITTDNFGIDAAMDERSGALVFRVLPRMKRYNNSDRVDRYTRLIQFLRAA